MKTNTIKKIAALLIAILMLFTLTACAAGESEADDAEGTAGSLSWKYEKDSKTLTISGSGEMPVFATSEEVAWAEVRASVETVKFIGSAESGGITVISDYAFYSMSKLKSIEIPASVTKIGKNAFAFCSSLEGVTVPSNVTEIGYGAFEACIALKAITLPESVTSLGESAFAQCAALSEVNILAPVELKANTFRNCNAITTLVVNQGVTAADNAFSDTKNISLDKAVVVGSKGVITVKYVFEDGTAAFDDHSEEKKLGEEYRIESPAKEGYTADILVVSGTSNGLDKEVKVTYKPNAPVEETVAEETTEAPAETEAPAAEEDDGKVGAGTIIALVVMGVFIVGIIVFAVILLRPAKDAKKGKAKTDAKDKSKKK